MKAISFDAEFRHDGKLHHFTVPELKIPVCEACGEKVFNENVDDQITDALRVHLHLLFPHDIRAGLNRLNLTQKELAERLGIAEATLSRWLTDTQIQSRAMDNLLRLYFALPEARKLLHGAEGNEKPKSRISEEAFDRAARRVPKPKRQAELDTCSAERDGMLSFAILRCKPSLS